MDDFNKGGTSVRVIPVDTIWAKTGEHERGTECDSWMCLRRHLTDAADMAGVAWDRFVPSGLEGRLASLFDPDGSHGGDAAFALRTLAMFMAGIHDVGKANPVFQAMILRSAGECADAGRDPFTAIGAQPPDRNLYHNKDMRHEIVSGIALMEWLGDHDDYGAWDKGGERLQAMQSMVAGHHGFFDRNPAAERDARMPDRSNDRWNVWLDGARRPGHDRPWSVARSSLIDIMARHCGVDDRMLGMWAHGSIPAPVQAIIAAVVVTADWMASDQDAFPCTADGVVSCDEAKRHADGVKALSIPRPWDPGAPRKSFDDDTFRAMFPNLPSDVKMNATQKEMTSTALNMPAPGLIICEAPMGVGKTEAALATADILAARFGCDGLEFALPTMATTDAMYPRIHSWASSPETGAAGIPVNLEHGNAWLNQQWRNERSIHKTEWTMRKNTSVLAPIHVSTIDRVLSASLSKRHVEIDHLGLAGKVVIMDEMHSADAYMLEYVERILQWLGAYRTPVIILSATLGRGIRDSFIRAYMDDDRLDIPTGPEGYPVITCAIPGHGVSSVAPAHDLAGTVSVDVTPEYPGMVPEDVVKETKGGGCAAVIMNTVAGAQDMYRRILEITGDDPGVETMLMHSRFCAGDRRRMDSHLLDMLGPDGKRPHRLIVVATQVVEQSLDIDFDVMHSQLAPIDVTLQRAGRLHRHHRARPKGLESPRLSVIGLTDLDSEPPTVVAQDGDRPKAKRDPSSFIYLPSALLETCRVLDGMSTVALPDDIPTLIHSAYDHDPEPEDLPTRWEKAMASAENESATRNGGKRGRADPYRIDGPDMESLMGSTSRDADAGPMGVRDGIQPPKVMLLTESGDGTALIPVAARDRTPIPMDTAPGWDHMRDLNDSMIPLPPRLASEQRFDRVASALEDEMRKGGRLAHWQDDRCPVKGVTAIILNGKGDATVCGVAEHYDSVTGMSEGTRGRSRTDDTKGVLQ